MRKLNQYKLILAMCAMPLVASCDFQEINTNALEATDEEANRDGVAVGGSITALTRQILPVGTSANSTDVINEYQIAYNLSADVWSGYFSQDNNWYGGNNHLTYYLVDAWISATYKSSYSTPFVSWSTVKKHTEKTGDKSAYALAQILKISSWHKTLESFGPIPYKQAGQGLLVVPFDSEKEVYSSMFNDLKEAIAELTSLAEGGAKLFADYDPIYNGDVRKWVKYANSLMLRLAVRLKYCDPEMSKQWVKEALSNGIGVMTDKADEAQISVGAGYQFQNNISYLAEKYGECRVCTSLFTYLNAYRDPRLQKYCQQAQTNGSQRGFDGKMYAPVPSGHVESAGKFDAFSLPNLTLDTPTYLLRASEVYFLRAEAALEWPEFGDPEALYKQGIAMSFKENGIDDNVDTYLNNAKAPQGIQVSFSSFSYTAPAPTQSTPKFTGDKEQKLEKIMVQKWLALYPNGQEAWTEWRRTGYPKLNPVHVNRGGAGVTKERGIRRMVYPKSFSTSESDKANYLEALKTMRDQKDEPSARLWWDCRN